MLINAMHARYMRDMARSMLNLYEWAARQELRPSPALREAATEKYWREAVKGPGR